MKKLYLSCPYSHPNKAIRMHRVLCADEKAAELMEDGYLVFSPLSHSHSISEYCEVGPQDHDFWLRQDLWILRICDEIHVLCLEGWLDSKGLIKEVDLALELGMSIIYHHTIKGRSI